MISVRKQFIMNQSHVHLSHVHQPESFAPHITVVLRTANVLFTSFSQFMFNKLIIEWVKQQKIFYKIKWQQDPWPINLDLFDRWFCCLRVFSFDAFFSLSFRISLVFRFSIPFRFFSAVSVLCLFPHFRFHSAWFSRDFCDSSLFEASEVVWLAKTGTKWLVESDSYASRSGSRNCLLWSPRCVVRSISKHLESSRIPWIISNPSNHLETPRNISNNLE